MPATRPVFTPFATEAETIRVTPEIARCGLLDWAAGFKLGTAGYRDLLDPEDLHNTEVPFNSLNLAVMLSARAQLALEDGLADLHVGGEVRPHTQAFIDLSARIYAAAGLTVHLRPAGLDTTPIWLSSFGVNYDELAGGENFTASHSPGFKGGWKPMDATGMQLMALAGRIAERTRLLARQAGETGLDIPLAAADDVAIVRDFDPIAPYADSLRAVVPAALLDEIPAAFANGFRASICTEGGSMGVTARRVFADLGIGCDGEGPVSFTHEAESPDYHGIGIVDGVNHGVDPGKWQVYKYVGAQDLLKNGDADVVFIWDPDGDRFNMITVAPAAKADAARAAGLEVDPLDDARCLVYFRPNQIYFMLTAVRLETMFADGTLGDNNWVVATTWPTSRSIGELAEAFNRLHGTDLKTFRVPVGFKYFGSLVGDLERQILDGDETDPALTTTATDVTGEITDFGPQPRMVIMAEESGGAAMGADDWQLSRDEERATLAIKEKDGMQIGVMSLGLAARLHRESGSFAEFYMDRLDRYGIVNRIYERQDVTLYDEQLRGEERVAAQAAGNRRKEETVAFFAALQGKPAPAVAAALRDRLPADTALPEVGRCFDAGDGTLIEFEDLWFELRASGTDAVLRYYMEGVDADLVHALNTALTELDLS
jgi:phosphomannomutase